MFALEDPLSRFTDLPVPTSVAVLGHRGRIPAHTLAICSTRHTNLQFSSTAVATGLGQQYRPAPRRRRRMPGAPNHATAQISPEPRVRREQGEHQGTQHPETAGRLRHWATHRFSTCCGPLNSSDNGLRTSPLNHCRSASREQALFAIVRRPSTALRRRYLSRKGSGLRIPSALLTRA